MQFCPLRSHVFQILQKSSRVFLPIRVLETRSGPPRTVGASTDELDSPQAVGSRRPRDNGSPSFVAPMIACLFLFLVRQGGKHRIHCLATPSHRPSRFGAHFNLHLMRLGFTSSAIGMLKFQVASIPPCFLQCAQGPRQERRDPGEVGPGSFAEEHAHQYQADEGYQCVCCLRFHCTSFVFLVFSSPAGSCCRVLPGNER